MIQDTRLSHLPIRFANFLSPLLADTYQYITKAIGDAVAMPAHFAEGQRLEEFANGQVDVGFLCGLQYVRISCLPNCPVEFLAAPVLVGERYQGHPIYFSDLVVHQDSPYQTFEDIAGCRLAYNEQVSHSGWNIVCYSLLVQGKTSAYFRETLSTGSHLHSLQAVADGKADAAAIDSHLLDVLLHRDAAVTRHLRVLAMLGPSAIPPVVVSKGIAPDLKQKMQIALTTLHTDSHSREKLQAGLIKRFVPVEDENYQNIRQMFACVQASKMYC